MIVLFTSNNKNTLYLQCLPILSIITPFIATAFGAFLEIKFNMDNCTAFVISTALLDIIVACAIWRPKIYKKKKNGIINVLSAIIIFLYINVISSAIFPSERGLEITLLRLAYVVVIAPILEEIVFRGICIDCLSNDIPKGSKCLFSALLFAICHLNFGQGLVALWSGYFLAKIRIENGIKWSILAHMLCNIVSIVFSGHMTIALIVIILILGLLVAWKEFNTLEEIEIKPILSVNLVVVFLIYIVISILDFC